MRLATVEDFKAKLKLPNALRDNPEVIGRMVYALDAATVFLTAKLKTGFGVATGAEAIFFLDSRLPYHKSREISLLLPNMFVDENTTAVGVTYASTFDSVTTEGTVISAESFRVDAEKGIVGLTDYRPLESYVRVVYDHGFEVEAVQDPIGGEIFIGVPDWLRMAALEYALYWYADCTCDEDLGGSAALARAMKLIGPMVGRVPNAYRAL